MTDKKKDDFTSLDLMPEYIHEDNPEVDNLFSEAGKIESAPSEEVLTEPANPTEAQDSFNAESSNELSAPTDTVEESGQLNFNSDFQLDSDSSNESQSELNLEGENSFGSDNFSFEESNITEESSPISTEEFNTEPLADSSNSPEIEPEPQTKPTVEVKKSPPPPIEEEEKPRTSPETLNEVKQFVENMQYGKVGVGGNPPFSIILKNIKYEEDAEDILIILKEFGIATGENETNLKQSLKNGSIIISQISEYAAIFLTHKLRRFQADILMGLAEELHPSKGISVDFKGLSSKETLFQNKKEFTKFNSEEIDLKSIIITTTQTIEGKSIKYYIGVATEHLILSESELINGTELIQKDTLAQTPVINEKGHLKIHDYLTEIQHKVNELNKLSEEEETAILNKYKINLQDLYEELALKLKRQAQIKRGNAVVGVNYQINPLALNLGSELKYKVTCTGSIVWISSL